MKNADFVALLTANCNKTTNLRVYSRVWPSGARRVPTHILNRIGCLVSLLQKKINEKILCDPDTEGIIIYNFQPILVTEECKFCSIDMLIVPIKALDRTGELNGVPKHLVVDLTTSEVVNNTKSMLDLGLIDEEDIQAEAMEPPIVYGKCNDYEPTTCFMALATSSPLTSDKVFAGFFDTSDLVKEAPCFDTHLEAQEYLRNNSLPNQLIVELSIPKCKKEETIERAGFSHVAVKTFSSELANIHGSSRPTVIMQEHKPEDEERLMLVARSEAEVSNDETVRISGSNVHVH